MPEQASNIEVEPRTPETAVGNAVTNLENNETSYPRLEKAKEWMKSGVGFGFDAGRVGFVTVWKVIKSLLVFAKEAIVKKGQIGFSGGMKIAEENLSFQPKKGEK